MHISGHKKQCSFQPTGKNVLSYVTKADLQQYNMIEDIRSRSLPLLPNKSINMAESDFHFKIGYTLA